MTEIISGPPQTRADFEAQIAQVRPKLHRYSARMLGSALDAEDIVQDGLTRAFFNWPEGGVRNLEGWLFRIVHNRAIDHIRHRERVRMEPLPDQPIEDETPPPFESREMATFALSIFLQLPPLQRSALILKDVLGYSLSEVSEMLDISVGSVKSALFRGRENLCKIAPNVESTPVQKLGGRDAERLKDYVDRFIRRDFDGIRDQLVEDVSLDLVRRVQKQGASRVGRYFTNYLEVELISARPALFEGRPAMHVTDEDGEYVVILEWRAGGVSSIRDFRYARYLMDGAQIDLFQ